MILTVPDFIPISIYTYLSYFISLFTSKITQLKIKVKYIPPFMVIHVVHYSN